MRRIARWASTLALAFLLLPLAGCEMRGLTLRIADFGDGRVDGVWLWRLSEESGRFERVCRIDLGDPFVLNNAERLSYRQSCETGQAGMLLETAVERPVEEPEAILVDLWYLRREAPGTYKASLFTEAGESPLSPTSVTL